MKSLNQIIAELEDFATAHWQIHTFGHGDVWEISPQSSGIVYPVLWMVPQTASPTLNEVVDEFTVLCMDLVDSGERNETEVLSDTRQIILDVCAYYRQTHTNSYIIEFGGSIQPFTERDPERVSGHSLTIRIKQPHDYNLCAVPANAVPVPPIPSCADATVQNAASNPTYQASVASGGSLVLPQLKVLDSDGVTPILANYIPNTSGFAATCSTPICAAATITVNTAPFGTAPSGGALNVPVVNGGSNPVGSKQGSDWVIDNNSTFINGTQVTDQEAEVDANIFVTLDGAQSGTWNAGTQTWEVTGAACADANLEINGVQQETIASGGTFNLIATLDGVAGGSYNPATDTLSFTSNTGWIRPTNWIAIPSLTSADERFYGVLNVFENGYNQVGVQATNAAASINWGDGTANTVSNGAVQVHVYDYATIAATVNVWPDGRNYKQVLVDITRVGGAIARLVFYNATTINTTGGNNFVDIIFSLPNSTDAVVLSGRPISGLKPMSLCQRVRIKNLGASGSAFYQGMLVGMMDLRVIEFPTTMPLGQYINFAFNSAPVDVVQDMNFGTTTSMLRFWAGSQIKKHGNLIANSVVGNGYEYCISCALLTEFGNITMLLATDLGGFFNQETFGSALTKVGTINTPACTNISNFFLRCAAFTGASFTSCANITTTTNAFAGCSSLYWMEMFGLTRGVSFAATAMGNYGMNLFANSIGTASGAQTITVTGTPFGALLTALDATALAIRLVMTGKGYNVAN